MVCSSWCGGVRCGFGHEKGDGASMEKGQLQYCISTFARRQTRRVGDSALGTVASLDLTWPSLQKVWTLQGGWCI